MFGRVLRQAWCRLAGLVLVPVVVDSLAVAVFVVAVVPFGAAVPEPAVWGEG